jgi:hypothetical protein
MIQASGANQGAVVAQNARKAQTITLTADLAKRLRQERLVSALAIWFPQRLRS